MSTSRNGFGRFAGAVWILALTALLAWALWVHGGVLGLGAPWHKVLVFLSIIFIAMLGWLGSHAGAYLKRQHYREQVKVYPAADAEPTRSACKGDWPEELRNYLHDQYGLLWRQKVRFLLLVGEPEQIEAIAPGLASQRWLDGGKHVLIHGGSLATGMPDAFFDQLRKVRRSRPLDAIIWAITPQQSTDAATVWAGFKRLKHLARDLRWQLPLHLWQVCDSRWPQHPRVTHAVGCPLPERFTLDGLQRQFDELIPGLRRSGLAQMLENTSHDFLCRLSFDLMTSGAARWRAVLTPLMPEFKRGVPLRGLWFSMPLHRAEGGLARHWPMDPAWQGIVEQKHAKPRWQGWHPLRVAHMAGLALVPLGIAGLLISFSSNRAQMVQVRASAYLAEHAATSSLQLLALSRLRQDLVRLDDHARNGEPWRLGFGLSRNYSLLQVAWPRYAEANRRLVIEPTIAHLKRQLAAFIQLPPDSAERTRQAPQAYEQLKAYLMQAHPDKADPAFLAKALGEGPAVLPDLSQDLWDSVGPGFWQFYGEQLVAYPYPRIRADDKLIAQARQILLGQLGQRNAEASLYQQVLDAADSHYAELELSQMVGETDALSVFDTPRSVPGVFTRQAWEGQVRKAIEEIAEARREEIDWVLSDSPAQIAESLTVEVLKQRLTDRYFQDYGSAWLVFLNSLRWQSPHTLNDVIEQLTLITDVRQSPFIALMNTLAYQGQAGTRTQALGDSLIQSAQKLMATDKVAVIDQQQQPPASPLDATFGPWLALMGKNVEGNDSLGLQTFLTRVTRVRLKLQQVSDASDPQAMTQALAQTVFQGKGIDLTDTRAYGSLIAASLGGQWSGAGQALFVQPLEQAWQKVLQPSAASLNAQWQRAIVDHWHGAFAGRYPFAATASDASLPMLGQMIRSDSGRIEQFLRQQLGGVLRKEGNRWVADPRHSQGLRFNPKFLAAVNQLSDLADLLYTDGGMGLSFELQAKAVRDLVQTNFVLDGERHHYFNQKESWQRFNWPGRSDNPGTSLTWTSVRTGERLYGDFQGVWGLIRLLEQAKTTPLDDGDSRYRVVVTTPDGIDLTWHLRTELGAGPLALLKLRGFNLPRQIFLTDARASYASSGNMK